MFLTTNDFRTDCYHLIIGIFHVLLVVATQAHTTVKLMFKYNAQNTV